MRVDGTEVGVFEQTDLVPRGVVMLHKCVVVLKWFDIILRSSEVDKHMLLPVGVCLGLPGAVKKELPPHTLDRKNKPGFVFICDVITSAYLLNSLEILQQAICRAWWVLNDASGRRVFLSGTTSIQATL